MPDAGRAQAGARAAGWFYRLRAGFVKTSNCGIMIIYCLHERARTAVGKRSFVVICDRPLPETQNGHS